MTTNNELHGYVIFSKWMAGVLLVMGNELQFVRKDYRDDTKNVYIFTETDKLLKDIETAKSQKFAIVRLLGARNNAKVVEQ